LYSPFSVKPVTIPVFASIEAVAPVGSDTLDHTSPLCASFKSIVSEQLYKVVSFPALGVVTSLIDKLSI